MPVCRGLLGVSVVVVVGVLFLMPTCCPTLPTNADTTHNIVNIAQTTLVHIRILQGPVWDGDHQDSRFSAVFL